jgi:hypothetical protein
VHVLAEQQWAAWLRRYDVANLWTLPMEVMVRGGKTQGVIGPVFLLAPLALLALRNRAGRRLILVGLVVLAAYFGNIGTRFLIPCLPFFSLAIALALGSPRIVLMAVVLVHALASWPDLITSYSSPYAWRIEHFPYQGALRLVSTDDYLRKNLYEYNVARMVEDHVPPGQRVFSLTGFPESYTSRDIISGTQAALNNTLNDILFNAWIPDFQPTRQFVFQFPETTADRVRLLETARGKEPQQWNVHEVRFLDHGTEVTRRPEWRLRAWPNPFEIQLAFDNSPVTRWRSWQTATPGMYIDVDFGRAEKIDEVYMETSRDFTWPIQIEVQKYEAGRWTTLASNYQERQVPVKGAIRRAATYELSARGIHYLLVQAGDWGAGDYTDDPEAWGLEVVALLPGATLYRVMQ